MSTISASCGVAVSAMLAANGQITDPDVIQTGSQLCVPSNCSHATSSATPEEYTQYLGPSASTTANCNKTIIVQDGDRCWQLWTMYGLSQDTFTTLNPNVNCSSLQVGQPVCVSNTAGIPVPASCHLFYMIKASDTCDTISSVSKLAAGQLQQMNPGLPCSNLTSLRSISSVCIRNSVVTPVSPQIVCTRTAAKPSGSTCAAFVASATVANLTLSSFQSLNPQLNCSGPIQYIGLTNQTSVCVAGRVVDPAGDFNNVANPARTTLLGQIVAALAPIDPLLPQLYSNFTAFPSTATNDYLAAELRETLNRTEAIQPAAQLEAQLGRSYLEQALFPQGVTSLCTFLETHLPNSQTSQCLCSNQAQAPVLTCAPEAPYDIHAASTAALGSAGSTPMTDVSHAGSPEPSAETEAAAPEVSPSLSDSFAAGQAATAGRRRLMQTNTSEYCIQVSNSTTSGDTTGLSQTALNQIATADQSAFTFTKVAKDFCSLGSDGKANVGTSATESAENEATKSQTLSQRFDQSTTGKAVKTISPGVTAIEKETQSQDQNACCTPSACIPIFADILQLCVSGGFCTPNFEVHTLHDKLVLCQALDVTALTAQQVEDAADEQDCGIVADSDSDVMQTYVDQKATISVGLCILHEIFAALKALDGGFTGCVDTTVNIYYLKGTIEIIPPAIPLTILELDIDVIVKAWDTPAGLCKSSFYSCDDFCTIKMAKPMGVSSCSSQAS